MSGTLWVRVICLHLSRAEFDVQQRCADASRRPLNKNIIPPKQRCWGGKGGGSACFLFCCLGGPGRGCDFFVVWTEDVFLGCLGGPLRGRPFFQFFFASWASR